MNKRILRLNLKRKWWELIRDDEKPFEFRLRTPYWRKRLDGRDFDEVHLCLGYPKRGESNRVIKRVCGGIRTIMTESEEFGPGLKRVYEIDVSRHLPEDPAPIAHPEASQEK